MRDFQKYPSKSAMDSGLKFPKNRSKAAVVEVAVEAMLVLRAVEATRE